MAAPASVPIGAIWLGTYDTPAEEGYYSADLVTYAQLAQFIRKITIGDATKDSDDYISSHIHGDFSGGGQVEDLNEGADAGRFWTAIADTTSSNRNALPPLVTAVRPNSNCTKSYPLDLGNDGVAYSAFLESGTWEVWGLNETTAAFDFNAGAGVALGSEPVGKAVRFDGAIYVPRGSSGYTRITGSSGVPTCAPVAGGADPTTAAPTTAPLAACFVVFHQRLWAITTTGGICYHTITQKDAGANAWTWPFALTTTDFPHIEASRVAKNIAVFPDKSGVESLYVKTDRGLLIYDDNNNLFLETHVEFPPHPDVNQSLAIWPPGGDLHAGVGLNDVKYSTAFVVDPHFGLARDHGLPQELRGAFADLEATVDRLYAIVGGVLEATAGHFYNDQVGASGTGDGQFVNPRGLAVDSTGAVFVTDTDNERVQEFDADLTYVAKFGSSGTGNGAFAANNGAYDIAIDSGDLLFVVDRGNGRIQTFSNAGVYSSQFGTFDDGTAAIAYSEAWALQNTYGPVFNSIAMSSPSQVARDSSDNIYIADTDNDRLVKINSSGVYQASITGLTDITGVCVDSSDNIYVAYTSSAFVFAIKKYNSSLTLQWTATGPAINGEWRHLATDGTHVYVTVLGPGGLGGGTVDIIKKYLCSTGAYVADLGAPGTGNGQFANPYGIAVGGGEIYVVDADNSRVQVLSTTGTYVRQWAIPASCRGCALTVAGQVLIANPASNLVNRYSNTGTLIDTFAQANGGGIVVGSTDLVWAVNATDDDIDQWELVITTAVPASPPANGAFNLPESIDIKTSSGRIYVADTANHRVQYFTSAGAYEGTIGTNDYSLSTGAITASSADGKFTTPTGIAVNQTSGEVYVLDTGNDRVQVFSATGVFARKWGTTGLSDGQLTDPTAIAINPANGNVFVTDSTRDDVQEFTSAGVFVRKVGASGTGNGQFQGASGLGFTATGDFLYVSDLTVERVQEFTATSAGALTAYPSLHTWTGVGWHGLWKGTNAAVVPTHLKAIAATGNRGYKLWWGANDGFVYYIELRRTFHNPRVGFQAGVDRFATSGYIEGGDFDSAMQGFDKIASHLILLNALATQDETIAVEFRVDGGGWESLGTVTTDGRTVLPFDLVDGFSRGRRFNKMALRYLFARGATETNTPVMDVATLHYTKIPQNTTAHTLSIPLVHFKERGPGRQYNDLKNLMESGEFLQLVHRIGTYDSEGNEVSAMSRVLIAGNAGEHSTGPDLTGRADLSIIGIPDGR